jgi:hypothetical protein
MFGPNDLACSVLRVPAQNRPFRAVVSCPLHDCPRRPATQRVRSRRASTADHEGSGILGYCPRGSVGWRTGPSTRPHGEP